MENEQFTTLVNTLLSNNLASSPSEARRMAEDMIGTSEKVQNSFKKENHTYMVSNFSQKEDFQQQSNELDKTEASFVAPEMPQLKPEPASNNESLQQNIQEIRERAINPQPVDVQVDFQTPQFDSRHEIAVEAAPERQVAMAQGADFVNLAHQPSEKTQELTDNFKVNIPGVDTTQSLNNLNLGATNTPQAVEAPTREKDDFLTVRLEASSEQTPISTPTERLQAPSSQTTTQSFDEFGGMRTEAAAVQQAPATSFGGLETGFPAQEQPSNPTPPTPEESAPPVAPAPQINTPERKRDLWTPEERQLKEDCDLSKVFNFSGK